jgi:hypothetical protein
MKCIVCRFKSMRGDKAFIGGVALARLIGDKKTGKVLISAFSNLCKEHHTDMNDLKDLKLLKLSEAIVEVYQETLTRKRGG